MKKFAKVVFGSLDISFLIKYYVLGALVPVIIYFSSQGTSSGINAGVIVFMILSFLLFPFTMYVYKSILGIFFNGVSFLTSIIFMVLWVAVRTIILFMFSIPVGIIGATVIYLTQKNRIVGGEYENEMDESTEEI
ncbi:hypothetical protein [Scatolibacter rhodanostii]|uniref:hypothetical protein n=1 Tax=Scatolibacter rhodanostii TaxID=2014781 RepID=UPI000C082D6C|nr:hypothetical protein [Scatolibacter rhodanostii]